jgi:hypothetical protein
MMSVIVLSVVARDMVHFTILGEVVNLLKVNSPKGQLVENISCNLSVIMTF